MSSVFPPGFYTGSTGQTSMSLPPSYSAHTSNVFLTVFIIFILVAYIYLMARFMMRKQRKVKQNEQK